jgi:radical SAM superfamily enzyme YgiQ (UPF0313 family)
VYGLLTTRGCPYRCTYCANNAYADLYPDWCKLRQRSPDNVIAEIEAIRARLPEISAIIIRDDTFLANSEEYIREFARQYQKRVGLPLRAYTTAQTASSAKLQPLVEAGLCYVIMGIQSGSERIQKLYRRMVNNERMLQAARLLHEFRAWLPRPTFDVITDNPYENADDRYATLKLVHQLKPPYRLSLYSLTFYPGTELYDRANQDRLIKDELEQIYSRNFQRVKLTYYNLALFCHSLNLPRPILYLMSRRWIFDLMSWGGLDWLSGQALYALLAWRQRNNQQLFERRKARWLVNG